MILTWPHFASAPSLISLLTERVSDFSDFSFSKDRQDARVLEGRFLKVRKPRLRAEVHRGPATTATINFRRCDPSRDSDSH